MSDAVVQTLPEPAPAPVLACGAFLKNRVCALRAQTATWSVLHGDLDTPEARAALLASLDDAPKDVQALAHDLHPDFPSTHAALQLAERLTLPAIAVQHHHAHIAAVIAERGLTQPVIGLALDGVGLGTDGTAWGGEVLWVGGGRDAHRWRRVGHLPSLHLPGGDLAAREPWRVAAALLHTQGRSDEIVPRFGPQVGEGAARMAATALAKQLNSPRTTSAGRWFDAAAGALGLMTHQQAEAQAAIALERLAHDALRDGLVIDAPDLPLPELVAGFFDVPRDDHTAQARAAAQFHLALLHTLAEQAVHATRSEGVADVALSGGCFANRVLRERLSAALTQAGLRVHDAARAGCGDAGLALGQAWVAACALAAGHTTAPETR
jgi:hydrogenase maturation protein HypF